MNKPCLVTKCDKGKVDYHFHVDTIENGKWKCALFKETNTKQESRKQRENHASAGGLQLGH